MESAVEVEAEATPRLRLWRRRKQQAAAMA